MNLKNKSNCYVDQIGALFNKTPKAVFAAIAVSALTTGGDYLELAQEKLLEEWSTLYFNKIIPQRPPKAKVQP